MISNIVGVKILRSKTKNGIISLQTFASLPNSKAAKISFFKRTNNFPFDQGFCNSKGG
uniref:Uncharacterized protein n=1 Tax=Romanomermis culicivorax TaxID=13658 RepID=A0A915IMX4_ROMCU